MKRICVFAHWDKDNIIDDYVIYYLNALKEVNDTIIFVSDCDIDASELKKLNSITEHIIAQKHGEYDFGSYKRGFLYAKAHNIEFDELLLVNDSCYGPFYPLKPIFDKMSNKKCDFWGLTTNSYGISLENNIRSAIWEPHIQSYFMLFKSKVFNSSVFNDFIKGIKAEDSKDLIIKNYEINLTKILHNNKFKSAVYINRFHHTENCLSSKWKKLILKYKFPFIKTSVVRNGIFVLGEVKDWKETIEKISDYPTEFITINSERYRALEENLYSKFNLYRKIRFNILNNSPMELRKIVIYIEKYGYKILNTLFFNKLKKF